MHNNFCRVSALWKCCWVSYSLQLFTPIYKGVKETMRGCQRIKESLFKLDQITNDLLLDLVIVL